VPEARDFSGMEASARQESSDHDPPGRRGEQRLKETGELAGIGGSVL